MENNEPATSSFRKKIIAVKSRLLADVPDLLVLLCSCALTGASLVFVGLVFNAVTPIYDISLSSTEVPHAFPILQRAISTLSTTITSALIVVVGKRYVLYKLERGGIHSRRVALYSRPSVSSLAYHLVRHGLEIPLLALLAVWVLGLATGFTVNDAWELAPFTESVLLQTAYGSLDSPEVTGLPSNMVFGQLSYVMESLCSGTAGSIGVINITDGMQLASGDRAGVAFYPPPLDYVPNSAFSLSTQLNAFNISVEPLPFVPQTAQNLTCVDSTGNNFTSGQLWYEGGGNQTLSVIVVESTTSSQVYRLNASAIILGGLLQSTGSDTEFIWNGTTWPNVMSSNQWALDITTLVCNVTRPRGSCSSIFSGNDSLYDDTYNLINFAAGLNYQYSNSSDPSISSIDPVAWSTALGMAMGAYSSNNIPSSIITSSDSAVMTYYDILRLRLHYGIYVLIANIVVLVIMILVAMGLRLSSPLGTDFIDPTRLLTDPLKNSELFNVSLDTTIDAHGNLFMVVTRDDEFVLRRTSLPRTKDSESTREPLLGKKLVAVNPRLLADIPDLLVLLCSCALTGVSLVLVYIIFSATLRHEISPPHESLTILQRVISTLSTTITSALIIVVGKRYVLYKLVNEGISIRRVALYGRPTIGGLAFYLVRHGFEIPLLILAVVWMLGLATGLSVDDAWGMAPATQYSSLVVPYGSLDGPLSLESPLIPAFEQLSNVMGSLCAGAGGIVGVIEISGDMQLASGGQSGVVFYPPLSEYALNSSFSLSAQLNAFNISVELLPSAPQTAQNISCVGWTGYVSSDGIYVGGGVWYEGGDNQTLSIIAVSSDLQAYQLNASAIILGGLLRSTGNAIEFVWNGTTWPNVMSSDQWGKDIASLMCNATRPTISVCNTFSDSANSSLYFSTNGLVDFAMGLNAKYSNSFNPFVPAGPPVYLSTALGMAMGAYSSSINTTVNTLVSYNDDLHFTPRYGVYVLIANAVVSLVMVLVAVRLRMASHLGADFIDGTRLLMDPLKDPKLFNASLDATIDAHGNPCMMVTKDREFVLQSGTCESKRT